MGKRFEKFNGRRLISKRVLKGLSQEDLGKELGVSSVTINNWEKGRTKPKIENVRALDTFFGVKDDYWEAFYEESVDKSKQDICKDIYKMESEIRKIQDLEMRVKDLEKRIEELSGGGQRLVMDLNVKSVLLEDFVEALRGGRR